MNKCLNCGHSVESKFCPNCGQAITTKKISNKSVFIDIPLSFLNMDDGFGYTFLQILTRPIPAAKEYIEGKKVRYFRPLSFLLVITSLSYLLTNLFSTPTEIANIQGLENNQIGQKLGEIFMNYPQLVILMTIPFAAIGQFLSFLKKKGSFAHHFYYVIFIQSFISVITFIPGIVWGQSNYYTLISILFSGIVILASYVMIFKSEVKWYFTLFRCFMGMLFTVAILFLLGVFAVIVIMAIGNTLS